LGFIGFAGTVRNLARLRQIAAVFVRHGFGHVIRRLHLGRLVPFVRPKGPLPRRTEDLAASLVAAFQELGPTFIKLGQLLSTRPDLFPPEMIAQFRRLQDAAEPFGWDEAKRRIEQELGAPIEEHFRSIDPAPHAAASIAQVHFGVLKDGREVAVKVRRPGIGDIVGTDLALLRHLAGACERRIPELAEVRPVMVVDEFAATIRREMDFATEASNTAIFCEQFRDDPAVRVPRVHWDLSTGAVLVLERIDGTKITDAEAVRSMGLDPVKVARTIGNAFFRQYFETGIFQADPHPGNLLLQPDGTVVFVDMGMVGHLTREMRRALASTLEALLRRDVETIVDVYEAIGAVRADCDIASLKAELLRVLDKYAGMPIRFIDMRLVFAELVELLHRFRLVVPREMLLLQKSFFTATGLALALDPELDFLELAQPFVKELVREELSPGELARSAGTSLGHLKDLSFAGPKLAHDILAQLAGGRLRVVYRHENLDPIVEAIDRAGKRAGLAVAFAAAAGLTAVMWLVPAPPLVKGISMPGLVGLGLTVCLGWLMARGMTRP